MKKSFLVLLLLTCLSLLIYARTVNYPFVFDDHHDVVLNQSIRYLSNLPRFFISPHIMEPNLKAVTYRPFLYATYALNYAISGLDPWSYRALNILLHILCSFLVYLIALAVIRERGGGPTWPAAAAAIIFCVHPVQTEAVIYISARSALLVCTFFLISFYCYLNAKTRGGRVWMASSLIAFALALLTKETAAALLPVFFVLELYFKKKKSIAFSWYFMAALTAMTAAYAAVRLYFIFGMGNGLGGDHIAHWVGWISYFPIYIRLLLFPLSQSIYYPFPYESIYYTNKIQTTPFLIGSAIIIFLIFLLVLQFRRKNYLIGSFLLLAALSFLPEFVFMITDLVVEYRLYLPLAALCIAGAAVITKVSRPRVLAMAKYGTAAAAAVFLILSFMRAGVWASNKSIWEDAAIKYPRLEMPHRSLGYFYSEIKDYRKALEEFEIARSLNPLDARIYQDLGSYYSGIKEYRKAMEELEIARSLDPSDATIYHDLGDAYMRLGLYPQAEGALLKALSLNSYYALHHDLEVLYILERKDEKALQTYAVMAQIYPDQDVLDDVSGIALQLGRPDLAQAFRRVPLK